MTLAERNSSSPTRNGVERRMAPVAVLLQETALRIYREFGNQVPDYSVIKSVLFAVGLEQGHWDDVAKFGAFEQDEKDPLLFKTPQGLRKLRPGEAKLLLNLMKAKGSEVRANDLLEGVGIGGARVTISTLRRRTDFRSGRGNWKNIQTCSGARYRLVDTTESQS